MASLVMHSVPLLCHFCLTCCLSVIVQCSHVTRPLSNRLQALIQLLFGHYASKLRDDG